MTAYRIAPPPAERPRVNPLLERALLDHHHKHRRRDVLLIVVALSVVIVAAAALVVDPVKAIPIASFGIPGMFVLVIGAVSLWSHRPQLLERLRTGIPIHDVRRGTTLAQGKGRDFPTLYVDFKDGRTASLLCLGGEDDQISRIEVLLRIQMGNGDEKVVETLFAHIGRVLG